MSASVEFYREAYETFMDPVQRNVRAEAFGTDIGQNSWLTSDELDAFARWLGLTPNQHVLDVACGSGGPSLYLSRKAQCRVSGIDNDSQSIDVAKKMAANDVRGCHSVFSVADARQRLPFDDGVFDALVCIDSVNHLANRCTVFAEWNRVLRTGGRALFTDPVVVTGPVTSEELASRSIPGDFVFAPEFTNERLITRAGFRVLRQQDSTRNAEAVSNRWRAARQAFRKDLVKLEGEEQFERLQRFFGAAQKLAMQRRLSRIVYLVEKQLEVVPASADDVILDAA